MKMDVFISYKSEEKALAAQLRDLLITNGFSCWMAPESIPPSSDYASEISEAIDNCRIVLLVLSEMAQKSQWVPKEISHALHKKKPVIPFHIDESELVKPFDFTLTNVQRIEAYQRLEAAYQELLERISVLTGSSGLANIRNKTGLRSTPFVKNHDLIGRENEIAILHQSLSDDRIVFISGIGGTGKTELVNQYVSRYQNEYRTIIITKYESSLIDLIISEKYFPIEDFERNQLESDHDFAIRKLAKIKTLVDTDTLIVIDNFDTAEDALLDDLLHTPCRIVLTTRMNFDYLGLPVIVLEELEYDKQIELFKRNFKRPLNEQQMVLLDELLQLIQGHTLTIELIARLMAAKHLKMETMLEQLRNSGISPELTGTVRHGTAKAQTIYAHIESLFRLETLSDEETSVLQNLSLMPLAGVSFEHFMEWCHYESGECIHNLIERSWVKYDCEQDLISLHPVIADIVRSKVTDFVAAHKVMLEEISQHFGFKRSWSMNREERIEYGEIAKTLYYKILHSPYESYHWYHLLHPIFSNLDMFDLSIETIRNMKAMITDKHSLEQAWLLYFLSDICLRYHFFDEAVQYIEESTALMKEVGPDSFDLAYVLKHAAHIYHAMCRYCGNNPVYFEKAYDCLKESEQAFQISISNPETQYGSIYYSYGLDVSKEHDSQTASRYYAFAYNAFYRGDYEKALQYGEESYRIFMTINGEQHSDTHAPMQVLARIYSKLDRFDDAVAMMNRVAAAREILWGKDTYRYCDCLETIAEICFEHGRTEEGLLQLHTILEHLAHKKDFYANYIRRIERIISSMEPC